MTERVLHEIHPAQPVWVSDDRHHEGRESALFVAWRHAIPGDGRTYWYGLCATSDMRYEELTTVGVASNKWMNERTRREKRSLSP